MPATDEELREMVMLLERYRYQLEALTNQLNVLQATEAELKGTSSFLEEYGSIDAGAEAFIPIGGGVMIPAKLTDPGHVVAGIGSDVHAEMVPTDAAERIADRLKRVREMVLQTQAAIQQTEASAQTLQQQAEEAYQEIQANRAAQGL